MVATLGGAAVAVALDPGTIAVGLGELQVARLGELVAYSLGSCVAICLYDPIARVAGMAHVVLPASGPTRVGGAVGKFADTAVPGLLEAMMPKGARPSRIRCKIAGGAAVLTLGGGGSLPRIGDRNVEAVKAALAQARLQLLNEQTGGSVGRTIRMNAETGQILVRTVGGVETEL